MNFEKISNKCLILLYGLLILGFSTHVHAGYPTEEVEQYGGEILEFDGNENPSKPYHVEPKGYAAMVNIDKVTVVFREYLIEKDAWNSSIKRSLVSNFIPPVFLHNVGRTHETMRDVVTWIELSGEQMISDTPRERHWRFCDYKSVVAQAHTLVDYQGAQYKKNRIQAIGSEDNPWNLRQFFLETLIPDNLRNGNTVLNIRFYRGEQYMKYGSPMTYDNQLFYSVPLQTNGYVSHDRDVAVSQLGDYYSRCVKGSEAYKVTADDPSEPKHFGSGDQYSPNPIPKN